MTSTHTPLQYDYYDLPFCKRRKSKVKADNIGESLSGDGLTQSPYEVCLVLEYTITMCTISIVVIIIMNDKYYYDLFNNNNDIIIYSLTATNETR